MENDKDFKEENTEEHKEENMGKGYRTYAEAARNRKRDEITIYDFLNGLYYNVKTFPKINPFSGWQKR